jgi:hypothetical protein
MPDRQRHHVPSLRRFASRKLACSKVEAELATLAGSQLAGSRPRHRAARRPTQSGPSPLAALHEARAPQPASQCLTQAFVCSNNSPPAVNIKTNAGTFAGQRPAVGEVVSRPPQWTA